MQTSLIHFGVVIWIGMVVIDFVMAYCHFYGKKRSDFVTLRLWRCYVTNQYKQEQNGGIVTMLWISKYMCFLAEILN